MEFELRLDGKVAVVTGAGRGLGRVMAHALAGAGAAVAVISRTADEIGRVAEEIRREGGEALPVRADVTDEAAVEEAARSVLQSWGRVDVLVNNAGIAVARPTLETSLQEWQQVLAVNLTGAFLCIRAFGRCMVEQGSGKVINISSIAGLSGGPGVYSAYNAAKHGLIGLTRGLAAEWGRHGIQVNAIAPGSFLTETSAAVHGDPERRAHQLERIPLGRLGQPEELGPLVVYLASPASAYMTGAVLVIDGGALVRYY